MKGITRHIITLLFILSSTHAYAVNKVPVTGTVSPRTGRANPNQAISFTTTFSDQDGWRDIKGAYVIINISTLGSNCFYGYYNQNENKLYLRNDAHTAWIGGHAPHSANIIENSYAKINCANTRIIGANKVLSITWNITFKPGFTGTKNIYLRVTDDANAVSAWSNKGIRIINNQPPSLGTITPQSGISGPNQPITFTTTYNDPDGWQNIYHAYLLINTQTTDYTTGFCGWYNQNTNRLYVRDDTNNVEWLGGYRPGTPYVAENSYVKLNCADTTVTGNNAALTINWNITFKPGFNGAKNTYLYVKDSANAYVDWTQKGAWTIDGIPPTGTITINNGSLYTNSNQVTLTLSAVDNLTNVVEMRFSNDNTNWSTPEAYSATKPWQLTAGDGTKTIYVKYKDQAGNWSAAYSDEITSDTTPPQIQITSPQNDYITNQANINVSGTFADQNINTITVNGVSAILQAGSFTAENISLTNEGSNTIIVRATDMAGNQNSQQINITRDTTPPQNPAITINQGEYTNNRDITLTLSAQDAAEMIIGENQQFTNSIWEAFAATKAITLSSGDASKTIYIKYRDIAGNETQTVSDSIILDTIPPQIQITSPTNNFLTNQIKVNISGTFIEANINSITVNGIPAVINGANFTANEIPLNTEGNNTLAIMAKDQANNQATQQINVIKDTTVPIGTIVINNNADNTNNPQVTLTLSATDTGSNITQMQFSDDNTTWSTPENYTGTNVWTLTTGDGTKTVYVKYKDGAGNWSAAVNDTIILDTSIPQNTTININSGAQYTGKLGTATNYS